MQDVAVKALPPAHSPQGVPKGVLYDTDAWLQCESSVYGIFLQNLAHGGFV